MRKRMSRIVIALLLAGIFLVGTGLRGALADPVLNDTCEWCTVFPDWPSGDITGELGPYANDYDPANPGPSCTGAAAPGRDYVVAFELHCAGGISLTCHPSGFDASIYLVRDCSDIGGTCVAGSDEHGMNGTESLTYPVIFGGIYYVIIDAHDADASGTFSLHYDFFLWDFPPGACCFTDGHCEFTDMFTCQENGGVSHLCLPCDPNPCLPTPAERQHWGSLKALYR
jgi:hypothetical protein